MLKTVLDKQSIYARKGAQDELRDEDMRMAM
jgi:hypothetical protein